MSQQRIISFSAPGKIHLLGEHSVVYGKPALLSTINLGVTTTITPSRKPQFSNNQLNLDLEALKDIIEGIVKKQLEIKKIPLYDLSIHSKIPIGSGLGSSAAISSSYIAALLSLLKIKWDLNLINQLTFEAEKVFHGNPSGADPATVIFGGLIWFRKETANLAIIHELPFSIPYKLSRNFILVNTGKPNETTKEMVEIVNSKFKIQTSKFNKIFDLQEQLVKNLLIAIQNSDEKTLIKIIKEGQKNLESLGVVSKPVMAIIRKIEAKGGAAKICGGGGKTGPTGILLCYHKNPQVIEKIAKKYHLEYFKTSLGVEGLRQEREVTSR